MRRPKLRVPALAIAAFATVSVAQAGTIVNTFDNFADYAANGIIGDSMWDGVYLRFGDVPFGAAGGNGNGNTLQANSTYFPGFLGIQSVGGDFSNAGDDGFFLYKVVEGDFDVTVQSVPARFDGSITYDNRANNFSGLMVRAYNPDNSGTPYSTTAGNPARNYVTWWRFNQFNIDAQVRVVTNSAQTELNLGGSNDEIGSARYFRITRTGNDFAFYIKTNLADPWAQFTPAAFGGSGVLTRADWDGLPVQVGIAQAPFSNASRDAFFDDFELTGPNVDTPTFPTAPSDPIATATNTAGALTLSWTPGTPGNGSLVVMSTRPIQHNPVQGFTYTASDVFGDTNSLIGGANHHVVFNGTGTSVTVTNLGANNLTYYVAVFEYTGSGDSIVYNTADPGTNAFPGPGVITSAQIVAGNTDIPVNGATSLRLVASFSTGELSDQTANATWFSSNPSVADVNAAGAVTGFAEGAATITATFGSFTPTVVINVHSEVSFAEEFLTAHDYIADGVVGSPFDGAYLNFGDVPGAVAGGDGEGTTLQMNSQISNTNGLFMSSVQSTWNNTANDGPFLFKIVPGSAAGVSGDFQALVHIDSMNTLNGVVAGVMARLYDPANHGPGPNELEHHVEFFKVQDGATSARRTQDQAGNNTTTLAGGTDVNWMLLTRVNSTNFYFFERADTNSLWTLVASTTLDAAANDAPMEVGLVQQSTAGVNGLTTFDYFSLDAAGIASGAPPAGATGLTSTLNPDLSITVDYTVGTNPDTTAVRSVVVMRAGNPVSARPTPGLALTGSSEFGSGTDLGGGNYVVYVSPEGSMDTTPSVTVTGLEPGVTYYISVFTFSGSGASVVYSEGTATSGAAGFLEGIVASLEGGIPAGGIGRLTVTAVYTGGATVDVSSQASVASGDTNIIKVFGGVLTGVTDGMAEVIAVYQNKTNVASVVVRAPSFVDHFDANHDYLNNGVAGTGWDGLYNPNAAENPIPGSTYVPLAASGATVADANISSNGVLTITAAGDGWEDANAGGFFLFRYVPGDFQAAVKIANFEVAAFNQPGILARAYGVTTNGEFGAPFGTVISDNAGEYWVSLTRFDEFGIGTYARRNLNNGVSQNTQPDQGDGAFWLLINRRDGTNFTFYKRVLETDPWRPVPNNTVYNLLQFANAPMQVGVMAGPWSGAGGTQRTVWFDQFMLDVPSGSRLQAVVSENNVILSWPAIPGTLEATTSLSSPDWQPVSGTPTLGPAGYSLAVPIDPGADVRFFRLKQ